jgi:ATP-binding cassette subfamily F protein uup
VNEYVGGYTDWLHQRKDLPDGGAFAPAAKAPAAAAAAAAPAPARKAQRLTYHERRELAELPQRIQQLEAEQQALQTAVSDPKLFRRDKDQAAAALQRLQALSAELETAYERWDALENAARP